MVGVPPSSKRILAEMDESEHGERDMISKTMVPVLEAVKVARRHPLFKHGGDAGDLGHNLQAHTTISTLPAKAEWCGPLV